MTKHNDEIFKDKTLSLDDHHYYGCTFHNCKLVFVGNAAFTLNANHLYNSSIVMGGAALITIRALGYLYHSGAKALVESIFDAIRRNKDLPDSGVVLG